MRVTLLCNAANDRLQIEMAENAAIEQAEKKAIQQAELAAIEAAIERADRESQVGFQRLRLPRPRLFRPESTACTAPVVVPQSVELESPTGGRGQSREDAAQPRAPRGRRKVPLQAD